MVTFSATNLSPGGSYLLLLDESMGATLLLTDAGAVIVLRQVDTGWDRQAGPPGVVLATARVGGLLYAITQAPDGSRSLWEHTF